MEISEIEAAIRTTTGKGAARAARCEGNVPGVFYGPGEKAVSVLLKAKQFQTRVSAVRGQHLLRLKSSDPNLADKVVLVKEVQIHPVTHAVLHADFYSVDLTKRTKVRVPLDFVGKAEGVILGGVMQPIEREVEIVCLPMDIPNSIPVDVTHMNVGDTLHLSDIPMPPGVEAAFEIDSPVVVITAPTVEEAPVAAVEEEVTPAVTEEKKEAEVKEAAPKPS